MSRRPEGPPVRAFRPVRPARPDGPGLDRDRDQPRGDAHAAAAPSELIWGRHAAQAALESERPIHRIWCTPEMRFRPTFLQLLREAKASGALVEEVTWARLGQISGGAVHQGIVLQPAAVDTLDLGSLIDGCRNLGEAPLLVAVDGLTDPQNLGAILRSAEALGVHGLVLPQRRNAGLTGSVAKVAAGALEHLPVARVVNLNRSLETLREEGYRVVGLDPQGSVSLEDADLEGPLVVITGSEGQGLSVLTRRGCDQLVRIPLRGSTPSLNASVATALVLYEVARRGWMRGLRGTAKPPRLVRPHLPTEALRGEAAEAPSVATQAAEAPGVVAAERAVESSARGAEPLGGLSPGGEGLEAARDRIELAPLEPAPHVPAPLVVLPLEPAPPEPVLSMPEPPPEPVLSMPEPPLEPVPLDSSSAEPVHSTPVEPVDTTPAEPMDTTPAEPAWLETARAEEFSPESGSTDQPSESASPARVPEPPAQAVSAESPVETFATDIHL
jgi:23S rRNA (guanosine2251-2'-O)-methyltransferase